MFKGPMSIKQKLKISETLTGRKLSNSHKRNIGLGQTGNKHWNWSDAPSYSAVHSWLYKTLGKANKCSIGNKHSGPYNWHNKPGTYKRNKKDWIKVCLKCHGKLDKRSEKIKVSWAKRRKKFGSNGRNK